MFLFRVLVQWYSLTKVNCQLNTYNEATCLFGNTMLTNIVGQSIFLIIKSGASMEHKRKALIVMIKSILLMPLKFCIKILSRKACRLKFSSLMPKLGSTIGKSLI